MKKVAIVYFSGTGNTKYIAEKMKAAIIKTNNEVDLINIEKDRINPILYKKIIIGGPVYVEKYPEILLKYIENNLSDYTGNCMMFSTQAFTGATPVFRHAIKRIKHLNVTYYNYLTMPNNFYNFMFKKCAEDMQTELIKAASVKAERMVLEFLQEKINKFKISYSRVIIAEITYKLVFPFFRNKLMKKLSIDRNRCINCRVCERSCPAKSIKISPELTINNDCTFCQRCINACPKNAFLYKEKPIIQYKLKQEAE